MPYFDSLISDTLLSLIMNSGILPDRSDSERLHQATTEELTELSWCTM